MIGTLLATVGLPALARLVGGALREVDSPVARGAAEALDAVGDAFAGGAIPPEQMAAAHRHIEKMAEIESAEARTALEQVNLTMRAEAGSADPFVRRWRPMFGYCVALTWAGQTAALLYVVVATPEYAAEIMDAVAGLSVMWGVALSVLGINVVKRSDDKAVATGSAAERPGWFRRLVGTG